ncbi:hypothetical protein Tco_1210627 [Tanacetum coccineum]
MAQENYVERCSMQRPPLLEADRFCFWKTRFETYIKSKDIDLWQVIQNGDFVFMMEDPGTKMEVETPYELLKDDQKKQLGKNNEATWTLQAPTLAKVTAIKEAKDLATLPFDELISNLEVYEIILETNSVVSKTTTKEKVKSLALKAKFTRIIDSDVAIDSATGLIGSEEDAVIVLGIKEVKAQDKSEVATIAGKKVTSLTVNASTNNPSALETVYARSTTKGETERVPTIHKIASST